MLERVSDRVFKLDVKEVPRSVGVELLKPAYFIPEDLNPSTSGDGSTGNQPAVSTVPINGSANTQPTLNSVPEDGSTGNQPAVLRPALRTYGRKKVAFAPNTKN